MVWVRTKPTGSAVGQLAIHVSTPWLVYSEVVYLRFVGVRAVQYRPNPGNMYVLQWIMQTVRLIPSGVMSYRISYISGIYGTCPGISRLSRRHRESARRVRRFNATRARGGRKWTKARPRFLPCSLCCEYIQAAVSYIYTASISISNCETRGRTSGVP